MKHSEEKPLLIRADASTQMGIGHLMRCLALAQAWKDAGGKVIFITACNSEGLLQRLREEEFDIHVLADSRPGSGDWNYTKDVLAAHPDAWVVLDGYHFDEVYQQRVKESRHRLLVIDDMAHLKHYYADIVLNQNLHAEQLNYYCEPYTHLLLGTHYVLLRREFLSWKDWKRDIPEVAHRVLVTLGGGDPENHTLKVIQALQELNVPALEATVVIGASNTHVDVLQAAAEQSRIPLRLISDAKNMPELMAWADVAVAGGGVTSWELAYMGVPSLILLLEANQQAGARIIRERGDTICFDMIFKESIGRIHHALKSLLVNQPRRVELSQQLRVLVDGYGMQRILKYLEDKAKVSISVNTESTSINQPRSRKEEKRGLKIFFLGGKQAGCIGLLALAAAGCKIQGAVAYDTAVANLATILHIPTFSSIEQSQVKNLLSESDLLVCVHGREIVPKKLFDLPRLGGINLHPCLYRYKGANPIGRLLQDGCTQASVGVHRMTENVDQGEVIIEEFIDVVGKQSVEEVYNVLYPFYALVLLKAIQILHALHEDI